MKRVCAHNVTMPNRHTLIVCVRARVSKQTPDRDLNMKLLNLAMEAERRSTQDKWMIKLVNVFTTEQCGKKAFGIYVYLHHRVGTRHDWERAEAMLRGLYDDIVSGVYKL